MSKRINFSEEYPNLLSKRINFSEECPNLLSKRINFSEECPNLLSKRINFSEESKFTFFFLYTLIQGDKFPYQNALTLRVHPVILPVLNIGCSKGCACSKAHTVLCKRSTMRYPYWVFSVKSQKQNSVLLGHIDLISWYCGVALQVSKDNFCTAL